MVGASSRLRLWLRWVLANALAEALGLGTTALIGIAVMAHLGEAGLLSALALAALAVLAGTVIEGTVVGTAQWMVLRRLLPEVCWHTWTLATAAGALVAWTLGMLPSTLMSSGTDSGQAAQAEPSALVVYALAAAMGLALGPVLGFAQWIVLRRYARRAYVWMPANALAWALGMIVVFAGVDYVVALNGGAGAYLAALGILLLTGAVVGAIHGLALVWLFRSSLSDLHTGSDMLSRQETTWPPRENTRL